MEMTKFSDYLLFLKITKTKKGPKAFFSILMKLHATINQYSLTSNII